MGDTLRRLRSRKETLRQLRDIDDRKDHVVVVHYSCESFYDRPDGSTPRVTSIAVRNLGSGQTESFSIHKVAELQKIPLDQITNHYDQLEKAMLDEFCDFLQGNSNCTWVHWNMRDINYGFQAIEHRHKVLGGQPPSRLPEERKVDLARSLISIYGVGYAGHPRLESIVNINTITDKSFLVGKDEAAAFENGEFVKLHQSTLRKVDILAKLFGRTLDGTLKTMLHGGRLVAFIRKPLLSLSPSIGAGHCLLPSRRLRVSLGSCCFSHNAFQHGGQADPARLAS